MADTIYLKDGTAEYFVDDCSFALILRDKLGDDAARYFVSRIAEYEDDLGTLKKQVSGGERESDGWYQLCLEARDGLNEIRELLRASRIDKKRIVLRVEEAYKNLNQFL